MIYLDNQFYAIEDYLKEHNPTLKDILINNGIVKIQFDNDTNLEIEYVECEGLNVKLMGN